MTRSGPTARLAEQVVSRGVRPRLADFEAAMVEARRRRRRRGLQSAGAGAALAAVVALGGVHSAFTTSSGRDDVHLVDVPGPIVGSERVDSSSGSLEVGVSAPAAAAPPRADPRVEPRREPVAVPSAAAPRAQRGPAPVARTSGSGLIPAYCTSSAEWCQTAGVRNAGKNRYLLSAVMCLKAGVALGSLDYRTAREVDFELLAGSRVIWRWSDGQSFAATPHRISALAGDCYTWQTVWDQHDAAGDRVGKARLHLRVRNAADQAAYPAAATAVFMTTR